MGLALDEPKDNDQQYDKDGLTFLVEGDLLNDCGTIKVDFVDDGMRSGFSIFSSKPVGGGGGGAGCGSCDSGCGS